jgi:group I intron endonuclease
MEGDIYCLTSPSGKKYVGQAVKVLSNGKTWGYKCRWRSHKIDARNGKDYCRLLNNAIRKYGSDAFTIELLHECKIEDLDSLENYYIVTLKTMSPNGYNLISGKSASRQSDETKELRRQSMIGKNKGKVLDKRSRIRSADADLPKYVRHYLDSSGKEGYRISNHPKLKDRSFVSKYVEMQQKLQMALQYLNSE